MASIRYAEQIGKLTRTSSTTASLAASIFNIGGQQYKTINALTLNASVVGPGGIDSGVQSWKLYYVYAVLSNGTPALIASTNATLPSGYAVARFIGYFDTNESNQIIAAANTLTGSLGDYKSAHMTETQFQELNGPGWILANGRNVAGSAWAALHGNTAPDARGVVIRGKDNSRGINPDGDYALGTYQADQYKDHTHSVHVRNNFTFGQNSTASGYSEVPAQYNANLNPGSSGGGNETRMKNITANHFIKVN